MRALLSAAGVVILAGCSSSSANPAGQAGGSGTLPGASGGGSGGSGLGGTPGGTSAGGSAGGGGTSGAGTAGTGVVQGGMGGDAPLAGSSGTGGSDPGGFVIPTVAWPSAECTTKATMLLGMMSKRQKAAQMVMAPNPNSGDVTTSQVGAVFAPGGAVPPGGSAPQNWVTMVDGYFTAAGATALKVPILYGVDAVHGNNAATGTVIFPHNAGLGSTRDPELVEKVGQITAAEVAAVGINWTFGPMVSVAFDDRWGRVFESFSEDPDLTGKLAAAAVLGLQGRAGLGKGQPGIIACAKHWAGDGQASAGTSFKGGVVDRGDVKIDETAMRKYGIGPYLPAIQAGLGSIMVSDATWMGASMTGSSKLITDILKGELAFKGFVSTDWNAAVEGPAPGIANAAIAGVDMFMNPANWQGAIDQIEAGVPDARIDDAVKRLLTVKCEAGLFDHARDPALLAQVGSAEHRTVARQAVRESMVLLQNTNDALPLAKTDSVWVGGSGANSLANQCGGWTISWQGSGNMTTGTTIQQAIGKVVTPAATMDAASVAVVVLSEKPYAEFQGDSESIDTLPPADFQLLSQAKAAGKKVIAIVLSGRPVLIQSALANADAWIAAWLPGTEGDGVADVLFGDYKPTGKLSHSWPKTQAQANVNFGDPGYDPLFMLGHGLTY